MEMYIAIWGSENYHMNNGQSTWTSKPPRKLTPPPNEIYTSMMGYIHVFQNRHCFKMPLLPPKKKQKNIYLSYQVGNCLRRVVDWIVPILLMYMDMHQS